MEFNLKSTYKLALYSECVEHQVSGGDGRSDGGWCNRGKTKTVGAAISIAKQGGGNQCPNHMKVGLANLKPETNGRYLKHRRSKKEERDCNGIATNCFLCGITFG